MFIAAALFTIVKQWNWLRCPRKCGTNNNGVLFSHIEE
jgi:hypothetical protein